MVKHLESNETAVIRENDGNFHVGWCQQFVLIYARALLNELRNPLDVKLKFFQAVVNAIMIMIVFSDLGDYYPGMQNRFGALFFLTTTAAFGSIQGALATFSSERALFLRERINKSYSVSAYFWGRSLAEFPFQLLYPTIPVVIIYYVIKLNEESVDNFFTLIFVQILTYWYGVAYGLILSIMIPKVEVATALVPALIIPFMVLGGFFVNQSDIPYVFYPFEYLSMFKYGFQASVVNEFENRTYYCQPKQPCDPISLLSVDIGLWWNCLILFGLGLFLRILAFFALHKISNPPRPQLLPTQDIPQIQSQK